MALKLRVTGRLADRLGERAVRVFGVHGGRVGRANDNDWVLPDPDRYLSGRHAGIEYRSGAWYLLDTSSNGTFVNGGIEPLGPDRTHALKDGDRVRMGEYDLLVSISPDTDFPPQQASATALDEGTEVDFALATHGDLGAELDLKRLISDPTPPPDDPAPLRVSDAYGQSVTVAPSRDAQRHTRPQGAARPAGGMGHASPVQSFCRGAGLDPAALSPEQVATALALAGQLVREMALGLMTSLQHRAEQKSRYNVADTTISPVENNPFKLSGSIDELIARLFASRSTRFLTPLEAVRASFADIRRHEQATTVAMQDALAEYLRRFAPEQLEQQFDQGLARGGQPSAARERLKYWELYTEFYRVLAQASAEGLPHAFAEEFARAYETASEELGGRAPRSGGNRTERGS